MQPNYVSLFIIHDPSLKVNTPTKSIMADYMCIFNRPEEGNYTKIGDSELLRISIPLGLYKMILLSLH